MAISVIEIVKTLLTDSEKLAKIKEIIEDLKELVKDIKDILKN